MRKWLLIPLFVAAACTATPAPVHHGAHERDVELARTLAGRVPAGPPQSCVRTQDLRGSRIVDERTIIYEGPGSTLFVNHTRGPCGGMREGVAIRSRTPGNQLCEGDIITPFERVSGVEYGGCPLGAFQPFRRPG